MSTAQGAGSLPASTRLGERPAAWAAVLVVGIALVLTAQFILDGWADASETAHWFQHAFLFVGGLISGAATLRLYQLGSRG